MSVTHAVEKEGKGLAPLYIGMALFLLSESFLFGNLFWTYFYLRGKSLLWPPPGVELELPLILANTFVLLSSSLTMQWAISSARQGERKDAMVGILTTMVLGATFLAIKGWEWVHLDFRPWDHAYGSIFYTLTGFHGLHVLVGLVILGALLVRSLRLRHSQVGPLAVEVGGLYWHYVDFIWLFVFTSLYIIR